MAIRKEKRALERIRLEDLSGSVELMEIVKSVSVVNASEEGVCVGGADFPVGSVVRLAIGLQKEEPDISLYCKVVWASQEKDSEKKSGLILLNTNKILFRKDLLSFVKLIESARKQASCS